MGISTVCNILRKSVPIWCFSGPYFPAFGLNTERDGVFLFIQSECGKIRTRKTPNTDTTFSLRFSADETLKEVFKLSIDLFKSYAILYQSFQ